MGRPGDHLALVASCTLAGVAAMIASCCTISYLRPRRGTLPRYDHPRERPGALPDAASKGPPLLPIAASGGVPGQKWPTVARLVIQTSYVYNFFHPDLTSSLPSLCHTTRPGAPPHTSLFHRLLWCGVVARKTQSATLWRFVVCVAWATHGRFTASRKALGVIVPASSRSAWARSWQRSQIETSSKSSSSPACL
jgi:hypothetical protein